MVKLSEDVTLDPETIQSVIYVKSGSKIEAVIAAAGSPMRADLSTPNDEVIIHSANGSAVAIRGQEASQRAWEQLTKIREEKHLSFSMETKS